ncbi:GTP pyrophosphokinase [Lederbergia lenta]|uniref:RelA/SpoT domain-containing protein n=1 Tax=Lederbergia lenta TaxID=1467 RepID=A0A2X4VN57_LEDLE|nr:GTP pyrophosphokinase family protein [Lederbergia lenta]MCM3112652.1 GTP pyrophosphokinase family protein [Lederbergia lenta]MEC2323691.1 GTP pyrophosphokinase family protein [Lederbergia lenta]SQI51619.1 RelA/SpoT domain-containing protein [Lederbergia lenta]
MEKQHALDLNYLKEFKVELTRFMMAYKFACDEMNTKINILSDEFNFIHDYNPIEHVKSRVKSPESIIKKIQRKGFDFSLSSIKENIRDIAGIRITCSFIADIYQLSEMLKNQQDIKVIEFKDYIKNPKPNGYQSLHMIIEIPVFMSDRVEYTYVEVQIRTIAMDFWASLEHKIYYKYNKDIPEHLSQELQETAIIAAQLDRKMERLHKEVSILKEENGKDDDLIMLANQTIPTKMLETLAHYKKLNEQNNS